MATNNPSPATGVRNTIKCPTCSEWIEVRHGRDRLDAHIKSAHPDTAALQNAVMRDLLGLKEGEVLEVSDSDTATPTKATRAPKVEKTTVLCYCGCGAFARPGAQFLIGHDARLDGLLTKWTRGDRPIFPLTPEIAAEILPTFHKGRHAALATEDGRNAAKAALEDAINAKKAEKAAVAEAKATLKDAADAKVKDLRAIRAEANAAKDAAKAARKAEKDAAKAVTA